MHPGDALYRGTNVIEKDKHGNRRNTIEIEMRVYSVSGSFCRVQSHDP